MQKMKEAAAEFLDHNRIAVTGVSRTPASGYHVCAVNPNAGSVEGDTAYPSLTDIPGGVDAVVIATRPDRADATTRECHDLGINHVWMHRGPGAGSVSPTAASYGRHNGIHVIDGGCPLMFEPIADGGHKVMRAVLSAAGRVPRSV